MLIDLLRHPFPTPDWWVDLETAAHYVGLPIDEIVDGITHRELRASVTHPERIGDWMVPIEDLDQLWLRRQPASQSG